MAVERSKRSAFSVYKQLQKEENNAYAEKHKVQEESSMNEREKRCLSPVTKLKSRKRKLAEKFINQKRRKITGKREVASRHSSTTAGKKYKRTKKLKTKKTQEVTIPLTKSESGRLNVHKHEESGTEYTVDCSVTAYASTADVVSPSLQGLEIVDLNKPFLEQFNPESYQDSRVAARELFKLLISPVDINHFFEEVWELRPMVLRRHKPLYNDGLLSTDMLDSILRENHLEFTTNVDITSYEGGKRHTHNPLGRAFPSVVWEFFKNGCSVRVLNPQSYSQSLWMVNSTLQEYFQSCVGANVYLTPAGSQGFAPHYDDIDAFILQLEGRKHWKVYTPKSHDEMLPRYSSINFAQNELGQMAVDVVLEPGDLLYFPRGYTHQAATLSDSHSLHVTISANQKNTWGDLLEKLVPAALQRAIAEDVEFREGLPPKYLDYVGIVNSDSNDVRRKGFFAKISHLISQLINYAPIDGAADQMGASYIHDCLPPCLSPNERKLSVNGGGMKWMDDQVRGGISLTLTSEVRLLRHGIVRLVMEEDRTALYFSSQNSRIYHGQDLMGIDISENDAPAIEHLIKSYPDFISIDTLPVIKGEPDDKVSLCYVLYDQGLLLLKS